MASLGILHICMIWLKAIWKSWQSSANLTLILLMKVTIEEEKSVENNMNRLHFQNGF
jgi:hypothetical protein